MEALTEQLVAYEVDELLAGAAMEGEVRVVQKVYADRSVDALKQTASLLRGQPKTLALLCTQLGGKLTLLFGRSDDISLHAGNLLRDTLKAFGGNGGGRPELAQGGGVDPAQAAAMLDYARDLAHTLSKGAKSCDDAPSARRGARINSDLARPALPAQPHAGARDGGRDSAAGGAQPRTVRHLGRRICWRASAMSQLHHLATAQDMRKVSRRDRLSSRALRG